MKFLVLWRLEIARLTGDMMKAVLTMRDYAGPLEEQGKVNEGYHIGGAHGGGWINNDAAKLDLQVLQLGEPVYNFAHFDVMPLADMTSLPVSPPAG